MALSGSLVLPPDVELRPLDGLGRDAREQLGAGPADYMITRPGIRSLPKVIDDRAARLLKQFRTPRTIVSAVIEFSRSDGGDPERILDDAFPLLQRLVHAGFLVPEGSAAARPVTALLRAGEIVAGFEVVRALQVSEDTEVYQVQGATDAGTLGVLKVLRDPLAVGAQCRLEHEVVVLGRLDGAVNPRLLSTGTLRDGRHFALIEHCPGTDAATLAACLRWCDDPEGRAQLFDLCHNILDAYAHLHAQGIVHGDIHPANLLVDDRSVKIIDFGWAVCEGDPDGCPERGGVLTFTEPEQARAVIGRLAHRAASDRGEQYALAVLVDQLLTGANYLDLSFDAERALAQIVSDPPRTFAARGARSWPEGERVLGTALAKDRRERHRSVAEFARQLRHAAHCGRAGDAPVAGRTLLAQRRLSDEVTARYQLTGSLFTTQALRAPTCSVSGGRAGIAHGLYRMACAGEDPALLAAADAWSSVARAQVRRPDAFRLAGPGIDGSIAGPRSCYYAAPGVHLVQALISAAQCDQVSVAEAESEFVEASRQPWPQVELMMGKSSTLLGCALLRGLPITSAKPPAVLLPGLNQLGDEVAQEIWDQLDDQPPIGDGGDLHLLGMAHGWAGVLYSTLRWHEASGGPLPDGLAQRLRQLAGWAESDGRGSRWPATSEGGVATQFMSGWCNGTAGYVHLWTLAHRLLGDAAYLHLAEAAAWETWADPSNHPSLCCGLGGRAYGLLNFYQHSADAKWLNRAHVLAERASAAASADYAEDEDSLLKGRLGVAVLLCDLRQPESAAFPLFEGLSPSSG